MTQQKYRMGSRPSWTQKSHMHFISKSATTTCKLLLDCALMPLQRSSFVCTTSRLQLESNSKYCNQYRDGKLHHHKSDSSFIIRDQETVLGATDHGTTDVIEWCFSRHFSHWAQMLHDLIQCDCCHQNRSAVSHCVDGICTSAPMSWVWTKGWTEKYSVSTHKCLSGILIWNTERGSKREWDPPNRIQDQIPDRPYFSGIQAEKGKGEVWMWPWRLQFLDVTRSYLQLIYSVSRRSQFNFR